LTKLLAIGDMHLGRALAALPEDLRSRARELGPEQAWKDAVRLAIEEQVDAVLLAGDLVDNSRDFFVAYGHLKKGAEALAAEGIEILAVAGNHDTEILPRLAASIDRLQLVGEGGKWQAVELDELVVLGWSFPQPQVHSSPLASLPRWHYKKPAIGLLHCDLDQAGSDYAPVERSELEAAPVDAWLLGHIHKPDKLDSDRPMGYLGSITALRASETGARGPWLIHVKDGGIDARHIPLAPLRFDLLEIDCSHLESTALLNELILQAADRHLKNLVQLETRPKAVGLRIALTGQSDFAAALADAAGSLADDNRSWPAHGLHCFVHGIESRVLPRLDLEQLAQHPGPGGLLAQRLLALDQPGSDEYRRLIRLARKAMEPEWQAREFSSLNMNPTDDDMADWLRRAARQALTALLEQRRSPS